MKPRRGFIRPEALLLLIGGSTLAVTATVVTPRLLNAGGAPSETAELLDPRYREVVSTLDVILRSAPATLWVERDEADRLITLALWVRDDETVGRVALDEVVVLRYSPVLESVRAFALASDGAEVQAGIGLNPASVASDGWVREFMSRSDVESRLVAVDVTNVRVVSVASFGDRRHTAPDGSPGWIELTWSSNSVDSDIKARTESPAPARIAPG